MAKWVIAGKPDDAVPEVGRVYEVRHSRKGTVIGRCSVVRGVWITLEGIKETPHFVSRGNALFFNGTLTMRDTLCYLIERDAEPEGDNA